METQAEGAPQAESAPQAEAATEAEAKPLAERLQRHLSWLPFARSNGAEDTEDPDSVALLEKAFELQQEVAGGSRADEAGAEAEANEEGMPVETNEQSVAAEEQEKYPMDQKTMWNLIQRQDAALSKVLDFATNLKAEHQELKVELRQTQELCLALIESKQAASEP